LRKIPRCWLATGAALVVFYGFFAVITGSREHLWPWAVYLEAAWMQWFMLAIVIGMVLLGSIYFTAPSSTTTITFIVSAGILLLGSHLNLIALQQPEPMRSVLTTVYFVMPHLEWYDLRDFMVYDLGWCRCGLWRWRRFTRRCGRAFSCCWRGSVSAVKT